MFSKIFLLENHILFLYKFYLDKGEVFDDEEILEKGRSKHGTPI